MKHTDQEITVEKIKARIKEQLRNGQCRVNDNHTIDEFEPYLKKKKVAFFLNNKYLTKKVPLLKTIARKLYRIVLSRFFFVLLF